MEEESKAYKTEGFMQTLQWTLQQKWELSQTLFCTATLRFVSPFVFTIWPSTNGHLTDKSHVEYRASDNQEGKTAQE